MSGPSNPYADYGRTVVTAPVAEGPVADPYAAYGGKAAAAEPASGPSSSPASFLDRLTETQKPDPAHPWSYKEAIKAVGNIGAGPLGAVLHPIDALAGMGGLITAPLEMATGHPWSSTVPAQFLHSLRTNPYGAIESGIGQAALAEALPGIVGSVADATRGVAESGLRRLAGSGPGVASKIARQAAEENRVIDLHNADKMTDAQQKWQDAQQKAAADHRAELLRLKQKYAQDTRAAAEKARTGTATDRAQYQAKQLAAKQKYAQDVRDANEAHAQSVAKARQANIDAQQAYNRKIGETAQRNREIREAERAEAQQTSRMHVAGSQLIYGLSQLDKVLRDRAATMFDNVSDLIAKSKQPPLPGTELGSAARSALTKITGSSELPKPFRDILAKYPESEPETIEYQGAQIPKTNRLYDVLKQQGIGQAPPVSFDDLKGYYTETGAELSKGTLAGDVFTATKELHKAIGDMMQKMAKGAGPEANAAFWDSRVFYRKYMDTFHEPTGPSGSGSPVAQALLAKDPLIAIEKFSGKSGDRGVADLRQYSDSLANLAQDAQRTAQAKVSVPAGGRQPIANIEPPKTTPVPTGANLPLPPIQEPPPVPRAENLPLPPVLPEAETVPFRQPKLTPRKVISAADLQRANDAAVRARAAGLAGHLFWWTGVWPAFRMLSELSKGAEVSLKPLALMPAAGAAGLATEELMGRPAVVEFLTRATRQQIARIPPDLRGEMPGIVTLAKAKGVQVSPALAAYAAAVQRNQAAQQGGQQ